MRLIDVAPLARLAPGSSSFDEWLENEAATVGGLATLSSGGLGQLRFGLGKGPVNPLREQRDVGSLHRGAAPDAQAGRRVAVMREVEAGGFLLDHCDQLLDEVRLRIRIQRGDRRIGEL